MRSIKARLVVRLLGFALLIPAIALLMRDLAFKADIGLFEPVSLAQYWQDWWPQSFERLHHLVQEHISWRLWQSVLAPTLQLPAFVVIGGAGLVLLLATQRFELRRHRPRRSRTRGTPSRAFKPRT